VGGVKNLTSWRVPGAEAAGLTTKAGSSRLGFSRSNTQTIGRLPLGTGHDVDIHSPPTADPLHHNSFLPVPPTPTPHPVARNGVRCYKGNPGGEDEPYPD